MFGIRKLHHPIRNALAGLMALLYAAGAVSVPVAQAKGFLLNSFQFTAATPPSISYQACTEDASDLTTYTFSSAALGSTSGRSLVVVGVLAEDSAQNFSINSATIDGVGATLLNSTTGATVSILAGLMSAVATNTTGTISITFSEPITSAIICVYALYNLTSTTAFDQGQGTGTTNGNPSTVTNTDFTTGVALAVCVDDTQGATFSWTGLTVDNAGTGTETTASVASATTSPATSPSITCDPTGTGAVRSYAGSWG